MLGEAAEMHISGVCGAGTPLVRISRLIRAPRRAVLDAHRTTYPRTPAAFAAARREGEAGRALEFDVDRILDGVAGYAES